jgi:hypothetical protein
MCCHYSHCFKLSKNFRKVKNHVLFFLRLEFYLELASLEASLATR